MSPYQQYSVNFILPDNAEDFQAEILTYYQEHQQLLQQENTYIGLWHDPNTDDIFLDISVVEYDASKARDACIQHDQRAFFDLQTYNSVIVNKNATSGLGANDD